MRQKTKRREILDYLVIALSMFMGSVGLGVFLLPNHITMGGVGGLASILYWGFHIPPQVSYLVLNLILLAVALKVLGWRFCVKTIYAVGCFAIGLSLTQHFMTGRTFNCRGCLLSWHQFGTGTFLQRQYGRYGHHSGHGSKIPRHLAGQCHYDLRHGHRHIKLSGAQRLGAGDLRVCLPLYLCAVCRSRGQLATPLSTVFYHLRQA